MKEFWISAVAVVVLAVIAAFILDSQYQHTAAEQYTDAGVRLGDPGSNLVDWR